jgi:hypothetical protein
MARQIICAELAIGALLASASGVFGVMLPPELTGFNIQIDYNGSNHWSTQADPSSISSITPNLDGTAWHIEGAASLGSGAADTSFTLDVSDPFISSSFNVTNGLGTTQNFIVTVSMPAAPPFALSTMNGSISGSVLDTDGSGGATIATIPGSGFYEALVDGGVAKTLYADPPGYSYTAPLQGTANIPTVMFGPEPGPSLSGSIGIRNMFSLTAHDSGQMVSTFNIEELIPTPGALSLMGLCGFVATRRRR